MPTGKSLLVDSLSSEQKSQLSQLMGKVSKNKMLANKVSEGCAARFLQNRSFDVTKALALLEADENWRQQMDIANLNVSHVQDQLRTCKFVLPGTLDKKGRPIIIFNAAKHDPSTDFLETLKLAVYGFELAIQSMPEGVEELLIIENLDGFTKENADNRMVKYLLEVVQNHYPGRIGEFIAVNAPWYYRLLFKVVKPWLSSDLLSKVNIFSDTSKLSEFVEPANLTQELGGKFVLDIETWLKERESSEQVSLSKTAPVNIAPQIVAAFSDFPTSALLKQSTKSGWMKKQGGYVRKFNKRFCILTETIFYYYKEENGTKPEGFVELLGATVTPKKGNIFYITTAVNKVCVFSTSTSDFQAWIKAISDSIQQLTETDDDVLRKVSLGDSMNILNSSLSVSTDGYDFQDDNVSKFLCKDPHELNNLVKRARNDESLKKTKSGDFEHCVMGSDLVNWLLESSVAQSKAAADSIGQLMLNEFHLFPVNLPGRFDEENLYRFRCKSHRFSLNCLTESQEALEEPLKLQNSLATFLHDILLQYVEKGNILSDETLLKLRRGRDYKEFCAGLSQLQSVELSTLSPSQLILFFIQLYNLLHIHVYVAMNHFVDESLRNDVGCRNASYKVDDFEFSLGDIEDLLRGKMDANDPRCRFNVETVDVRALLAIRTGYWANEFPYDVINQIELSECLRIAGESFVMKTFQYNKKNNVVVVPELLKWFESDFGGENELLQVSCSFVASKSWLKSWKAILASSPSINYQSYQRSCLRFIPK